MLQTPTVQPSAAWADCWLGYELFLLSENRAKGTIANLRSMVTIMARHATKDGLESPGCVTPLWLQQYLLAQYDKRQGAGRSYLYKYQRMFWAWFSVKYKADSPMEGIPSPKGQSAVPPVLTGEEISRVLEACTTVRDRAIIGLLLDSGIRRMELVALDVGDIDLKKREVSVRCGKNRKARKSSFGTDTARDLWEWLQERPAGPGGPGALFTTSTGRRLTPGAVNVALGVVGRRAGVVLRPHILRHSWCHYIRKSGVSDSNVMQLAGWSSPVMLQRYGAALAEERALEAAKQIQVRQVVRDKGMAS